MVDGGVGVWAGCRGSGAQGKGPPSVGGVYKGMRSPEKKEPFFRVRIPKEKGVGSAKEGPPAEGDVSPPRWDDLCGQELPRPGREGGVQWKEMLQGKVRDSQGRMSLWGKRCAEGTWWDGSCRFLPTPWPRSSGFC